MIGIILQDQPNYQRRQFVIGVGVDVLWIEWDIVPIGTCGPGNVYILLGIRVEMHSAIRCNVKGETSWNGLVEIVVVCYNYFGGVWMKKWVNLRQWICLPK